MGEYNQTSFSGGMNLIVDDTRIGPSEYREAFNVRNRYDVLDSIQDSEELYAPPGNKQGIFTFGDYFLLFVAGNAFWQLRNTNGWAQIQGFQMDPKVSRYFVAAVPISTVLNTRTASSATNAYAGVNLGNAIVAAGTPSGIVVQDGINQPRFIWVDPQLGVRQRVIQKFSDWMYDPTGANDKREYVPVGTQMTFYNGILWVLAPDGITLLRSCSGRPLDFVINIDTNGNKGGDAYTTAYSVGVGPITCLSVTNGDGIFVSAKNRFCYQVSIDRTPQAKQIWGEPTFIRQYLFDANCINERSFIDVLGDACFIDPEGLRSFNAIEQLQNEGRNSIFSKKVSPLFRGILQDDSCCAIVFDNYALFSVNTIYGRKIIVYDTLTQGFSSIDDQSNGKGFKQFAQVNTNVFQLYGITNDDKLMFLYSASTFAQGTVRLGSQCSQNPKMEMQPVELRSVLGNFSENSSVTVSAFVNSRMTLTAKTKTIPFVPNPNPYTGTPSFSDVDTQINNLFFNFIGAAQGWKVFFVISWTGGGRITNVQTTVTDVTPRQPLLTQAISK